MKPDGQLVLIAMVCGLSGCAEGYGGYNGGYGGGYRPAFYGSNYLGFGGGYDYYNRRPPPYVYQQRQFHQRRRRHARRRHHPPPLSRPRRKRSSGCSISRASGTNPGSAFRSPRGQEAALAATQPCWFYGVGSRSYDVAVTPVAGWSLRAQQSQARHLELHEMAPQRSATCRHPQGQRTGRRPNSQRPRQPARNARRAACRPTHKATRTANRRPARQRHRHGSRWQARAGALSAGVGPCVAKRAAPALLPVPACSTGRGWVVPAGRADAGRLPRG